MRFAKIEIRVPFHAKDREKDIVDIGKLKIQKPIWFEMSRNAMEERFRFRHMLEYLEGGNKIERSFGNVGGFDWVSIHLEIKILSDERSFIFSKFKSDTLLRFSL